LSVLACCSFARAEDDPRISDALRSGMRYMIESASVPENFEEYASDYLFFFADVARLPDPWIQERAQVVGLRLGFVYMEEYFELEDADEVVDAASALYALECLGMDVEAARVVLQAAADKFPVEDYLGFDPSDGQAPNLDHLIDLLISFHFTDRLGIDLGVSYAEALMYIPSVAYEHYSEIGGDNYVDQNNLVTHLIYTWSGYASWLLEVELMPRELDYIRAHIQGALMWADPETLSEYVDSLQLMGFGREDPDVAAGIEVLLATQKPDGRWEPDEVEDEYDRYHSTWCAMDALREYKIGGQLGPRDILVKRLLKIWADQYRDGLVFDPALEIREDQ